MSAAEDHRIGRLLRAIRRHGGQRQRDLALKAGVPREDVMHIEAGRAGVVAVDRVRRLFAAAGGHARLTIWWNGADAERLLDARHAALVERVVAVLRARGWRTEVEVTFSEFGERGSIDILAGHERVRAVAVCEVKTRLGSLEETNRRLDVKERLGPRIAKTRFGWAPAAVGRLLILPGDSSTRRTVHQHALTMASAYPARSRELRAWIRSPDRPIRGLWFVSEVAAGDPLRPSDV
jgi:transcriptional regulator with XRE-family HTH domain